MENVQDKVNYLARLLRVQVIEYLVKEDRLKYGAAQLSDEELEFHKQAINRMPCCTAMLRRLFDDAHEMHQEKGMFPHAVCVGDLEWCLKYRGIGYRSVQSVKHSWLPLKADTELRRLPAFKAISAVYRPLIDQGEKILPPVDHKAVESEANAIINEISTHLIGER